MDAGFRAWSSAARYPSSFHCDKQVPTLKYMVAFLRCFSGCLRQVGTYRYLSTYPRTYLGTPHMLPTVPQGAFKSPGHRRPPMPTRDFTTHALRTAITKAVKKPRMVTLQGPSSQRQAECAVAAYFSCGRDARALQCQHHCVQPARY